MRTVNRQAESRGDQRHESAAERPLPGLRPPPHGLSRPALGLVTLPLSLSRLAFDLERRLRGPLPLALDVVQPPLEAFQLPQGLAWLAQDPER